MDTASVEVREIGADCVGITLKLCCGQREKGKNMRTIEKIAVLDVYRYAIRCRVGRELLEKARDRKAKKAERLARARQERAEKRLFGKD